MSLILCHGSHVMCKKNYKGAEMVGGGSVINKGLPSLVFRLFLIMNALKPNIYLSWLVVVSFGSLKKQIYENKILERLE